jgi:hypothetical protein
MKPNKLLRASGFIIFLIGILLGMILFGSLTWAGLESSFYFGFGIKGTRHLNLACPLILTASDAGSVTAYVENTTDRDATPSIQVDISNVILVRSERAKITVAAGKTAPLVRELTAEDVVFGSLILVHMYEFQAFTLPSASANCGIVYLNITGLSGTSLFFLTLFLTLLVSAGGYSLWAFGSRPLEGRAREQMFAMLAMGAIVLAGILLAWVGWWGPCVIIFALGLLLLVAILARYIALP